MRKTIAWIILIVPLLWAATMSNAQFQNDRTIKVKPNYKISPVRNQGCFYTENGRLYDANGKQFIIRGINYPEIWFDQKKATVLPIIAATGANTVRLVWHAYGTPEMLEKVLQQCVDLKLIAIPELHEATGSNSMQKLKEMAEYWASEEIKTILNKYQKYVLINIANEWSASSIFDDSWRNAYKSAVAIMRNAGIKTTIIIDSASYGQRASSVQNYGQYLLNTDPLHNLLFSIHMYREWNDRNQIVTELKAIKDLNLPLIIGEFGYNFNNGDNNLGCTVDAQTIMDECQKHGFGYIPWSWSGNDSKNAWLNMASFDDWSTLTDWGQLVINGKNGIKQTSVPCSVFTAR
jgi:mannan endo-1,4-beta-mannosidase